MAPHVLGLRQILPDIFSELTSGIGQFTSKLGQGASSILNPPPVSSVISASLSVSVNPTPAILPSSTESVPISSTDVFSSTSATLTPSPTSLVALSTVTDRITRTANVSAETSKPAGRSGFLQNKALSGFIFALVGLIGLILICLVATFALRRQRRKKLLQQAISFEPASTRMFIDDLDEKRGSGASREGGDGYEYGQYRTPSPSIGFHHPARPPMAFAPPNYPTYQIGNEAYDGLISSEHYQSPPVGISQADSQAYPSPNTTLNMGRRVPPPALPDTFGDGSFSPAAIDQPLPPLKITNQ